MSKMEYSKLVLCLPDWVGQFLAGAERIFTSVEERMRLVITLSRLNIEHGTGGPFGAAVFEQETGRLVAPGVNMVIPANCSIAHAEIVSISIAQQVLGHYDLSGEEMPSAVGHPLREYELVTSTAPCAMCLGAIPWSGVRRVICGARDEDARSIGFDEGTKPLNWVSSLETRGITIIQDVLREEARKVLSQYYESGGVIYNARQRRPS
jgi:tRNA(Arg) A34 adenosine deaminase TadA